MKLESVPLKTVPWEDLTPSRESGTTGHALVRTSQLGDVRSRLVEYEAGYRSDEWCSRGHIVLVLHGEVTVEVRDGKPVTLNEGMGLEVGAAPHRVRCPKGARVFIVD